MKSPARGVKECSHTRDTGQKYVVRYANVDEMVNKKSGLLFRLRWFLHKLFRESEAGMNLKWRLDEMTREELVEKMASFIYAFPTQENILESDAMLQVVLDHIDEVVYVEQGDTSATIRPEFRPSKEGEGK